MPLFGSPQASQNLTAVLDNLLKYAQEDALQQDRAKSQMDYLGAQQQGYLNLADFNAKNTSTENRVKAGEAQALEGTKYNFKNREIRDQLVADLSKLAPVQQLSGMDFYNKQNNISDPTTTIALHQTVQNAALAQAKVIKGADLSPKEIEDIMSMGPTLTKDLLDMKVKADQFNRDLPIKQQTADTGRITANASMLDAQTKATTAAGKDPVATRKDQLAVLKQVADSIETSGVSAIPPGSRVDRETMGKFLLSQNPLTPEWAGMALEFITQAQFQVAGGKPLEDWQGRVISRMQNRYRTNKVGFNSAPQAIGPGETSPVTLQQPPGTTSVTPGGPPPVVAPPPDRFTGQPDLPHGMYTERIRVNSGPAKPERQVLSDGSVMESYIAADGTKRWKRVL